MLKTEEQIRKLAAFTSVVFLATAEALAQDNAGRAARKIVVSLPDHKLAVVEGEQVVKIFPTAVGAQRTPSPTGTFQIVQRVSNPTWYSKGKVVGPGKTNPVGTRWIGLSVKGYGIHGTNNPASIGHNASHGCIRMRNRDVEELFTMVGVGDTVELHSERTPELDQIFGVTVAQAGVVAGQ